MPSQRVRVLAEMDPERIAVKVGRDRYTYAQLDQMADALARHLVERLGPGGHRVAHCVRSPLAMAVSDLAIDRAGKVAVGLGPAEPPDRLRSMLGAVGCSLLISDLDDLDVGEVPCTPPFGHPWAGRFVPDETAFPELAAIAFTSGSTGGAKAIMQSRDWSAHFPEWAGATDVTKTTKGGLLFAGPSAAAGLVIGISLVAGLSGSIFDLRARGLAELPEWIDDEQITRMLFVPTVLRILLATKPDPRHFRRLRIVTIGGEAATWEDVGALRQYLDPDAEIRIGFGLSEAGLVAQHVITPGMPIGTGLLPTGKAMPGVTLAIVDERGRPVDHGQRGEIVVEGRHCAMGYWRQPELSAEVFEVLSNGRRRVRTGDAGLLLADGTLMHLGRLDQMVKIAGNRVELAEVEAGLQAIQGISQAAASTYVDGLGNTRLCAYAVADARVVDARVVRAILSRRLPGPMIPDVIDLVSDLPVLPGGKVDRASLPQRIDIGHDRDGRVAPENDRERSLVAIWSDVLGLKRIGVHDDFFELGGDSLRAAQLFAEMQRRLGIDRPVSTIFEAPSVALFSAMLDADVEAFDVIVPFRVGGAKAPLFVVHGGGGDILFVRHLLPSLPDDQPVYGIQPPLAAFTGQAEPEKDVPALARRYCQAMRTVQPYGPYQIYGLSFGGWVAFEMALQLQAEQAEVTLLALGDTPAPVYLKSRQGQTAMDRLGSRLRDARQAGVLAGGSALAVHGVRVIRSRAQHAWGRPKRKQVARALEQGVPVPPLLRTVHMGARHSAMVRGYEPTGVFSGPLTYISATASRHEASRWAPLLTGAIEVDEIACTHQLLAHPPFTGQVGQILAAAIERRSVPVRQR
ncbi:MAG TPA: AMP-binding protein [Acidimicrobiales bacterium]|nr:AMP-binding protein [Acidimicrobiales bacterium]